MEVSGQIFPFVFLRAPKYRKIVARDASLHSREQYPAASDLRPPTPTLTPVEHPGTPDLPDERNPIAVNPVCLAYAAIRHLAADSALSREYTKELSGITGEKFGLLHRGKMAALRHRGPAKNVRSARFRSGMGIPWETARR